MLHAGKRSKTLQKNKGLIEDNLRDLSFLWKPDPSGVVKGRNDTFNKGKNRNLPAASSAISWPKIWKKVASSLITVALLYS